MRVRHYLNLTDGLEWSADVPDHSFVRIESTAIERGDWCRVFRDLDADLLMNLAMGNECHVYDCGTRRETSKTISVGVPYIKDKLRLWWIDGAELVALTDGWREAKRKVMYFRRYLATDEIRLVGHSRRTDRDGDLDFYKTLAMGAACS